MSKNDESWLDIVTDDITTMYIREISEYPLLSEEETISLVDKMKNGSAYAREKLINSNLRLVVHIAKDYVKLLKHMKFLDVIQSGNEGLIKAIDRYDYSFGNFSTFAYPYIQGFIKRAIANCERSIRIPSNVVDDTSRYLKFIKKYEDANEKIPEDEYICDVLGITTEALNNIKLSLTIQVTSIVKKDDEGESEEETIQLPADEKGYDDVLNSITDNEFLLVLKEVLSSLEYYILHKRYISHDKITQQKLGEKLEVKRQNIDQAEKKIKEKISFLLANDRKEYYKILKKIKDRERRKFNKLSTKSITPDNIVFFLCIKNYLTKLEKDILYMLLFSKYDLSYEECAREQNITLDELNKCLYSIKVKRSKLLEDKSLYEKNAVEILRAYKTGIFKIDLLDNNIIDYNYLIREYGSLTYPELLSNYGEVISSLSFETNKLLRRFFTVPSCKMDVYSAEMEINFIKFGYRKKDTLINIKELYNTFVKNKNEFSSEQALYLECFLFNKKDSSEYLSIYKHKHSRNYMMRLIHKLEILYFNINLYLKQSLDRDEYIFVREKFRFELGEERINLLDMLYGVGTIALKARQISSVLNISLDKIKNDIKNAKDFCFSLYANRNKKNIVDKAKYIPYFSSYYYKFTKETQSILTLYLMQDKNYEEISKILGIPRINVNNIIINSLKKLDFYRYNIVSESELSLEEVKEFISKCRGKLDEVDIDVINLKYVEHMDNEKIADELKIDKLEVNRIVKKINKLLDNFRCEGLELSDEMILSELAYHASESVLTNYERFVLSNYITDHSIKRVSTSLNISKGKVEGVIRSAKSKIKLRHLGYLKPLLSFIERDRLNEILNDKHLPISENERYIICSLFELYGTSLKTIDEISEELGVRKGEVKRTYMTSILKICKYLNNEIEGNLNYHEDIEPILKYFGNFDRLIIKEYYLNNLTFKVIGEKYNVTNEYISYVLSKINRIMKNSQELIFDFEYFEEAIKDPKLPFYGDLNLAISAFNLLFGMNGKKCFHIGDIIKELNLNCQEQYVVDLINELMVSVCKLRIKIEKENSFTYDEILDYYSRHESEITYYKKFYVHYLKKKRRFCSKHVIYDLMKERIPDIFRIKDITREDCIKLIRKYYKVMSKKTRNILMAKFNISEREFMNGHEKIQALRVLQLIDEKSKVIIEDNENVKKLTKRG